MASFKYEQYLKPNQSDEFDKLHNPGVIAPHAGIYRCYNCGHEIGTAKGHKLPPETHPMHPADKPIQWRLVVYAMHHKAK